MKHQGITTFSIPARPSPSNNLTKAVDVKQEKLVEVSPPQWSGTVKAMKKHPEITNPWALSWWMKGRGDKPHYAPEPKTAKAKTKAKKVKEGIKRVPFKLISQDNGQTIFESYPGHKGRKGQRGGSAPKGSGGVADRLARAAELSKKMEGRLQPVNALAGDRKFNKQVKLNQQMLRNVGRLERYIFKKKGNTTAKLK